MNMTKGDAERGLKRPVLGHLKVQGLCAACSFREDEQLGGVSHPDSPMPSITEGRLPPATQNIRLLLIIATAKKKPAWGLFYAFLF